MTNSGIPSVCAVVVAFHPDHGFGKRLYEVLSQVTALVVIDNTPEVERIGSICVPTMEGRQTLLIENHDNLGVAAALNQGLEYALLLGCTWLLTLDQDTRCHSDMVETLLAVLAACQPPPAVIGSNYFDRRNGRVRVPIGGSDEFFEQKTVITSGSLVAALHAKAIGGFRSDYFIDQLDHEFCLRVRAHGGRVVICRKPVMEHCVGEPGGATLPLLGILPSHPPVRKYYVARNSLVTIAAYWRREPGWCLRRGLRLLGGVFLMAILERQRYAKVKAFVIGVADAVAGRMGAWSAK